MPRLIVTLLSLLFLAPHGLQATVQVVKYVMTKPLPPACAQAVANYPPAYTSFLTTDAEAYLWFYVTGTNTGDVFATEYYTPAGQLYADPSGAFDPLSGGGNWCFVDSAFQIAGHPPATLPGTWTVRAKYNGALLFTLTFAITSPASTCAYTLSPSSASFNASGGSGTASVTAGTGCTWTAASGVTWITTASTGSGNGTVSYTVAANTSTSSRSGTVTAGGQTLTVTEAGVSGGGTTPTSGNLIQNGNAEAGPASTDYSGLRTIPGWTTDGNVTVYSYTGGGDYPTASSPGPSSRGKNFFGGGFAAFSRMTQVIDLSASASAIDSGNQPYTLDAWLGGYLGQDDNAVVRVAFKNASTTFGTASIGPVLSTDRSGATGMVEKTATGKVPSGTRTAEVSLEFTRVSGSANDGYADNLYFGLTTGVAISGLNLNINQVIDTSCPNNKIIVSVTDAQGNAVTGLTTSNFTLREGGAARTITVVPAGAGSSSGALSLAILIDVSGSLSSSDLTNEKAAAKQLISQMTASDMVAVYSFTDAVTLLQDFTSDKTKLNAAADAAGGGGSTALYQAISAASQALGARAGRRSIVLMTDGEDTVGGVTIDQAIAAAKQAGVPVFPVGFGSANQTVLTRIATETGGFYSASSSSADLQRILQSLGQVISSQYEISYTSGNTASDNTVDITVSTGGQTATATRTVSKCSSGGAPGCTYLVQPQTLSIPAAGATGTVLVITQAGCALNPSVNVTWFKIIGSSQGAVSYQVDPNLASSPRTAILTIGNRTIPVTQDGGVSCGYSLAPISNVMPALGGTSSFRVVTSPGCPWSATASGGWLHLTSVTSGAGSATIIYTADANTSTLPRAGAITAAGLTFSLSQSGGASATAPTIAQGGIVNAASNRASAIARGSFFTIYGTNLGPAPYQQVGGWPIPDNMGGVTVTVSKGSYNKRAYLHFVSPPQINGILPSDAPLGDVQVTVSYNGNVSSTSTVTVVDTAFGSFSTASGPGPGIVQNYNSATDQPLNMASYSLKPNQIAVLWGTGLGPITTGDNNPAPGGDLPVPVEVRVGGKLATKIYSGRAPTFAGVDNIYFYVPADAPLGCSVPVQITAGNTTSNTVRIAISADGKKCQDPANPFGATVSAGGTSATLGLLRIGLSGQIDSAKPPVDTTFDVGLGIFSEIAAGGELAYSPFMSVPPVGTCVSTNKALDFGAVLGAGGTSLDRTATRQLDAGTELTVTGPKGTGKLPHFDPNAGNGPYVSLLGGAAPMEGAQQLPLFLEAGSFTITGPGGKDVGAFSTSLTLPTPITWTNRAQIATIQRSAGFTLNWMGGGASQTVLIAGGSTDQKTKKFGGFMCLVPATAGTFAVPPNVLADLPVTGSTTGLSDSIGMLAIAALPMSNPQKFTAPGLTSGYVFHAAVTAKAVQVQ